VKIKQRQKPEMTDPGLVAIQNCFLEMTNLFDDEDRAIVQEEIDRHSAVDDEIEALKVVLPQRLHTVAMYDQQYRLTERFPKMMEALCLKDAEMHRLLEEKQTRAAAKNLV
jgi:hypothetical protein